MVKGGEDRRFSLARSKAYIRSRLVSAGCYLYGVQEYLGHSSIKVTERYSHLAKEYLKRAINLPEIPAQVPSKLPLKKSNVA